MATFVLDPAHSLSANNVKDGQIALEWTGGGICIPADPGDLNITVGDAPIDLYLKRGCITDSPLARRGEEVPVDVSFSFYALDIGDPSGQYQTVLDSIWRYSGKFAANNLVSTLTNSDLTTCTLTYSIDGSATGDTPRGIRIPLFVPRASFAEGRPNTVSVTGQALVVRPELF